MRRTPLRAKPPKRAEPIPREVREALWRRAEFRCEARLDACEDRGPWSSTRAWLHPHHRYRQQHGIHHTLENLLLVCATDHAYIHAHPEWAYGRGLLIHRHDGPPSEPWSRDIVDNAPREM